MTKELVIYMLKTWKDKTRFRTIKSAPNQIWVPKDKIIYIADILSNKGETPTMIPRQWMFTTHNERKVYHYKKFEILCHML